MDARDSRVLLQAVAGVVRTVRSLYGPRKLRKQVTDELDQTLFTADAYTVMSALQSQNAGTAVLQQALDEQRKVFGTGCTSMVNLCGVLAEAVLELNRQGLPGNIIQQALSLVKTCCLKTAKHMRIPLTEALPSFQKLTWPYQLAALGLALCASDRSIATSLAASVVSLLDPIRCCGEENLSLEDLVTMHIVLGGVTSSISSRTLNGVLLPIVESDTLWCRFSTTRNDTIIIDGGVVILAGDLKELDFIENSAVQVIFVHGELDAKVTDASASTPNSPLCIPVSSYATLCQLAEMNGVEIVDSWEELLPCAIGHQCLQIIPIEVSASRHLHDEDDDEFTPYFLQVLLPDVRYQPHASVIVQGPTKSLAIELRNETRKMICRLRNTLRSGYVIPGNGGFWCACAAAVAQEANALTKTNPELLSFATAQLADPLIHLGVILLENSSGCVSNADDNDSFFSRSARVRTVQKRFDRGVRDVGVDKFFSRYYDFRSPEYALLSSKTTEPESEDGRVFHVDEYKSMSSSICGAFRVVQLLLNIDHHRVNYSTSAISE